MNDDLARLSLFAGFGIELEYMIVDAETLDVRPIADEILRAAAGELTSDYENGAIAWSNELALHVLELKTNGPASNLAGLPAEFQKNISQINMIASQFGAQLMPTAMHPWMDPNRELKLWPHEYNPVYEAYNRIFDCRGHGWANLQSTHINLPFANDYEFGQLHAAIRLVLPLIPALAASSPVADRRITKFVDFRMEVYRNNSKKVPSIAGRIIPEPMYTEADYNRDILEKTYADIAPWDPDGILQQPFLNSRGAIARFERGAIEIRVMDIQECVSADIAIVELIAAVLKLMTDETFVSLQDQKRAAVSSLADLFLDVVRDGELAEVRDSSLLSAYGIMGSVASAGEIWNGWFEQLKENTRPEQLSDSARVIIEKILSRGSLSRRIQRTLNGEIELLPNVYHDLCGCLQKNQLFGV